MLHFGAKRIPELAGGDLGAGVREWTRPAPLTRSENPASFFPRWVYSPECVEEEFSEVRGSKLSRGRCGKNGNRVPICASTRKMVNVHHFRCEES